MTKEEEYGCIPMPWLEEQKHLIYPVELNKGK